MAERGLVKESFKKSLVRWRLAVARPPIPLYKPTWHAAD